MSRWAVTLALAFLVGGCSSAWVRPPGVDEAQFKQDNAACRAAAFYVPIAPQSTFVGAYPSNLLDPDQGFSDVARRNHLEEACMEAKGYKRQQGFSAATADVGLSRTGTRATAVRRLTAVVGIDAHAVL